jgi:hypothetical protein
VEWHVLVSSVERFCHAVSLFSCQLPLCGMYVAMIFSGASAVLKVAVMCLPLCGLMSVSVGVMCGAVMMETPV